MIKHGINGQTCCILNYLLELDFQWVLKTKQ